MGETGSFLSIFEYVLVFLKFGMVFIPTMFLLFIVLYTSYRLFLKFWRKYLLILDKYF